MWNIRYIPAYNNNYRESKHIYVGESRLVTKNSDIGAKATGNYSNDEISTYYYHSDHLGSAQLITDYQGNEYERLEYTPYGELWINHKKEGVIDSMPYRFTGQELDSETGFYCFSARYLDPRTSRWISTDPAINEYVPTAGSDNSSLPGMGGVYNLINMHTYHYAGNNPVKYTDPDGRIQNVTQEQMDHLRNEYNKAKDLTGADKGAAAANLRKYIKETNPNLEGLFNMDPNFMNGDLRDFLNLNDDGTANYNEDKLSTKDGWNVNDSNTFHKDPNYKNITKYENEDGREIIFGDNLLTGKREQINSDTYRGTYNYAPGNWENFGKHGSYDVAPWAGKH